MAFKEIAPEAMEGNAFKLIGKDWMLITAGSLGSYNTMTASWGGLGVLWNRNVSFCFVRPTRYTFQFMESAELYTLSFFTEDHREALNYCGAHSGRDVDKASETGLTPFQPAEGTVSFQEARLILLCKKIYTQDFEPGRFLDPAIDGNYPKKDYHRIYIGQLLGCLSGPIT
jgi:flavin reductase (DIM6/NTAB) family NADH-FMN oxidoreductase RutF